MSYKTSAVAVKIGLSSSPKNNKDTDKSTNYPPTMVMVVRSCEFEDGDV
jgi:hypothetical protein